MSTTSKVTLGIIIVIIIGAIIYLAIPHATVAPAAAPMQPATTTTYVASSTDTSDAAIDQDMSSMNTQLNGINSSETEVDGSMNQTNQ
jgi:peptidoglycan hydrolase CwlO-like protein